MQIGPRDFRFPLASTREKILASACLACVLWASQVFGQSGAPTSPAPGNSTGPGDKPDYLPAGAVQEGGGYTAPMPLAAQYQTFFAWTIHLDEAAAEHEKRGESGAWLRTHLEESLGLSPAEVDLVRQAARRNAVEVETFNEKIYSAVRTYRANFGNNPLPPEISDLLQQEAAATMRTVSDLEEKLGSGAASKLENWRESHLAQVHRIVEQRPLPPDAMKAMREFEARKAQEMQQQIREQNPQKAPQIQPNVPEVHQ